MARQVQFRRGTSEEHKTFVGALGEITLDTDSHMLRIHDGETPGGIEIALGGVAWFKLNAVFMAMQGWQVKPCADNPEDYEFVLDFGTLGGSETAGDEDV